MTNILFICTATPKLYIGLVSDGCLVYTQVIDGQKHASEINRVYGEILEAYPALGLSAVACNLGPGSYTGLRVGLSFAKALCVSLGAQLIGLDTLETLAHSCQPHEGQKIFTTVDARRLEVFGSFWASDFERLTPLESIVLDSEQGQRLIAEYGASHTLLVGSGAAKSQDFLVQSEIVKVSDEQYLESLNKLSLEKYEAQDFADVSSTRPEYGKPAFVTQAKKKF